MAKTRRTGANGTALQAAISLAFVMPAAAQPAPNARPQGGQVVAGNATIIAGVATTTITQSTNRAAINWRSFDVGSNQSVMYQQPNSSSVTLNRVTGPDPSAIAGSITANGQLILTNPSGVVFHAGAQVNAQSVIVSAPGITNRNFMAGRMVFDQQANPNARIENAGTITVKQAGLAALVAPSVANSGTITARLGHVVLAGAAAHTLDMYGDGLVSIDITKQVTQAPVGPGGKTVTALVTNTGTIAADGGTVQLTAAAADRVVNTLVSAGGTIHADTAGGRTGQIEITGTGGSVVLEGRVAADGRAPGTAGGSVVVAGSDTTNVAPSARISASGRAGGGTVAVGTTLARARGTGPAPSGTSQTTFVAAGARISADATANGDGGRVTVLSTQSTTMAGAVTARGGPSGGNGGTIELSGEQGFALTGTADTSAPHGTLGTVILDPRDLTITSTPAGTNVAPTDGTNPNIDAAAGGTTTDSYVTPAQIQALTGNVRLQTTRDLVVASSLDFGGSDSGTGGPSSLTLEAGRNLTVNSGVTITVPGTVVESGFVPGVLTLSAATSTITGYDPAGTLTVLGNLQASGLALNAGTGGIVLGGALSSKYFTGPTNVIDATAISTTGPVVQTAGSLVTNRLSGSAASIALTAAGNQISSISGATPLTATLGSVTISNSTALTVTAGASSPGIVAPAGQTISLLTDTLTLQPGGAGVPALSAPGGTVTLQPYTSGRGIILTSSTSKPGGSLALTTAETGLITASTLQFAGSSSNVTFGQTSDAPVDLIANGNFAQVLVDVGGSVGQNALLRVNALARSATAPLPVNISLDSANTIPVINNLASSNDVVVTTSGDMAVLGTMSATSAIELSAGNNLTVGSGTNISGLTALYLSAGRTNTAGVLTVAGTVSVGYNGNFTSGNGGILLSGAISLGGSANVSTTGPLTQTGGALGADTLSGSASSVSLPSRGNTLNVVSGLNVTNGDFLLVDSASLQVYASSFTGTTGVTVPTGRTVTLVTDSLQLPPPSTISGGSAIAAPGGTLVVAPYTSGNPVLLTSGAKPSSGLSLTSTELASVRAATLQFGGAPGSATVPVAGAVTIGQPGDATIDLGARGITRLVLNAAGAVTQTTALGVTTLAGRAGSLSLPSAGNFITQLDGFTATAGDLALHTSSGLTVSNAVAAPGNVTLSSVAAVTGRTGNTSLLLSADVSGATVRFDTTDGSGGARGIEQTAGIVTAGTLTGAADTLSLPQPNQITNLGDFTTRGALTLTDGRALAVTGNVTSSAGAVTLNAQGITQTPASSITATELDGSSSADTVLDSRLNAVRTMGSFSQTGGSFTLATSSPELDFGANSGQVVATSGSLTFVADRVGIVTTPAAGTGLTASAGMITFAPFTPSRPVSLVNANTVGSPALELGASFRSYLHSDTLALGRAGYAGPITLGGVNETINLSAFRALQLQTSGAVTQGASSALTVSSLTGSAGSVTLTNSGNQIASLGPFTSAGGFSLTDATSLTVAGALSDPTAISLNVNGDLTLSGSLSSVGTVTLTSTGTITQPGGAITAGTLTGSAAGSALLGQTGNSIATLAGFTTGGDFTLADGRSLVVSAPVDPNTIRLSIDGDLSLNSSVTGGTVVLNVTGTIVEGPGGRIVADTLTGAASSAALGGANQVAAVGAFATGTGFALTNAGALTLAGPVSDGNAISVVTSGPLTLTGDVSAAAISLTATGGGITQAAGSLTANTLTVSASDALTQSGGSLSAGTLSGSADSIDLGRAGPAAIGQVAGLSATGRSPGTLTLVDTGPLLISGTLSARYLSVTAAGSMVLANGAAIRTDGQPASAQLGSADAAPGSNLTVRPGPNGRATLTQAGTVTVAPLSAPIATLRLDLPPSGGAVSFNNLQAGPADLVLSLGSGTATGSLVANNLTVLGAGGRVTLTGTIAGRSGPLAAETAQLRPGFDVLYTLNGCAIAAVSCSGLQGLDAPSVFQPGAAIASALASVIRPDILVLDVLDLSVTRDRDDPTLLLPNISDKDY